MKREIIITADGSTTIHLPDWNEQYHSKHGAIQEAYHVFIKHGLEFVSKPQISILEIGFGTGLNAFISLIEATKKELELNYVGVEAYPVDLDEVKLLNYVSELKAESFAEYFNQIHANEWEKEVKISDHFSLTKRKQFFHEIQEVNQYDLVYFDAFGARVQPDLWTKEIFAIMYEAMKSDSILVTYAAKGSVRRAMQSVGFEVERLPGPPGKREMLRALKRRSF